jgi:hypothetical protein
MCELKYITIERQIEEGKLETERERKKRKE